MCYSYRLGIVDLFVVMDGVSIVEDAKLRQGRGAHSEVLKPNTVDRHDVSLDGSSDLDGNNVFKGAVEAESLIIDSENSVRVDGGNAEIVKTLENGKENSNLVMEVVERGIGAPKAALNSEDFVDKAELLVHEEHPDEKQIAVQKVIRNEMNESMDYSKVLDENVDSAANGETRNLDGEPLHNAEQDFMVNESQQDMGENVPANVQFELRKNHVGEGRSHLCLVLKPKMM